MSDKKDLTNNTDKQRNNTRYIPVTQWNEHHAWPPQGGLRHLIFHAYKNGFNKVIKRKERRILIDDQAFLHGWKNKTKGRSCKASPIIFIE